MAKKNIDDDLPPDLNRTQRTKKKSNKNTDKNRGNNPSCESLYGSNQKNSLKPEIISILMIGISVLLIISVFSGNGPTGEFSENAVGFIGGIVCTVLKGCFGIGAYVLPFIIIGFSVNAFFSHEKRVKISKLIMSIVLFLILMSFMHLVTKTDENLLSWYFGHGSALNGGFVGAAVGNFLYTLLGFGTYIVFAITAIILAVCITKKSFLVFIKNGFIKLYDKTKNYTKNRTDDDFSENDAVDGTNKKKDSVEYELEDTSFLQEEKIKSEETISDNSDKKKTDLTDFENPDNSSYDTKKTLLQKNRKNKELSPGRKAVQDKERNKTGKRSIKHNGNVITIDIKKREHTNKNKPKISFFMDEINKHIIKKKTQAKTGLPPFLWETLENKNLYFDERKKNGDAMFIDDDGSSVIVKGIFPKTSEYDINTENVSNLTENEIIENDFEEYKKDFLDNSDIDSASAILKAANSQISANPSQPPVSIMTSINDPDDFEDLMSHIPYEYTNGLSNIQPTDIPTSALDTSDFTSTSKQIEHTEHLEPKIFTHNENKENDIHKKYTESSVAVLNNNSHIDRERLKKDNYDENKPTVYQAKPQKLVSENAEKEKQEYKFPKLSFLKKNPNTAAQTSVEEIHENSKILINTLKSFNIEATMLEISKGPAVTRYELAPGEGIKVSKILGLSDNLALSLAAQSIRIEAPIPGKAAVGIEIPNKEIQTVYLNEVICDEIFQKFASKLAFGLGKDIAGNVIVTDITKMPHMLIAGATGSGKSVCINTLITSILYKATPDEVKLIMVDPKVVELSVYNGIPHLLIPVVTDPQKAAGALNWAVAEMMHRYALFAETNVRNLKGYNEHIQELGENKLPHIVIIIDELADLMMVASKEVEAAICRLAQLARAAGIHLVIATQRPSVDVITGLIKANIPSRIAFAVSSATDSRTILDAGGAEKLLGKGDMLFKSVDMSKALRIQGAFVSDKEVEEIVNFIKENNPITYDESLIDKITSMQSEKTSSSGTASQSCDDDLIEKALNFVVKKGTASISMLQRQFGIGYNNAAKLIDELEERGIVGPPTGTSKPRVVLMDKYELREYNERHNDYI